MKLDIEKVDNGYIVGGYMNYTIEKRVYHTLEDAMIFMLNKFEGRCSAFSGDRYGNVIIQREQVEK